MKTRTVDLSFQKQQLENCLNLLNSQSLYGVTGDFENLLTEYKLDGVSEVYTQPVVINSGTEVILSTTLNPRTLLQPCIRRTNDLNQFKAWIGMPDFLFQQGIFTYTRELPSQSWAPGAVSTITSLSLVEQEDIQRAGYAFLFGNSSLVDSYKAIIEHLYAPFEAAICAIDKLVIQPGGTLTIQGERPLVFLCRELEIVEGGNLRVYVPMNMAVQTLRKFSC